LLSRREGIVDRAEVEPSLLDDLSIRSALAGRGCFGKDNGETGFQVPVNMAMEEPCSRVVSLKADDDTTASNTDDVTTRGVDEVLSSTIARLDDIEGVSVQMEGMCDTIQRTVDMDLNDLILPYNEGVLVGSKASSGRSVVAIMLSSVGMVGGIY